MNTVKQLENAPRNLVTYAWGLLGAIVDDYALITLTIFCVLLGFTVGSVLISLTAFFGLYFLLKLVANIADVIAFHARATLDGHRFVAQSNVMAPESISTITTGQPVEGDLLP